ncbi:MAG: tetratricopeptide (TPR) repeat protein, partial [Myxococcota bacterium]
MPPRSVALIFATLLLVLSTVAYVAYAVRDKQLQATGAHTLVMERVGSDADIGAILGRPISRGFWVEAEHADYLTLRIPLNGITAAGVLELVSDVDGMYVESMILTSGTERLDLLVRDAAKLQTNSAREAWLMGATMLEQGQYADAVKALSDAIDLEETMANAWFLRGKARIGLRELEAAEVDLHEAARLDPVGLEVHM